MSANIKFERSIYNICDLPQVKLPEVILCGRSNVGKSTFINSLFNKKKLAKTSSSPGKTRSINYYSVDESFYIVDLPGYGYAKVSKKERAFWGKLISEFIRESENIQLAIHLIDCRHKPTELDISLNQLLIDEEIPYIVLLNKADKLKQSDFKTAVTNLKKIFPELILDENLYFYSALKGRGKKEIMNRLLKLFYL